jgi:aspartate aminotransferase-like enzyme
MGCCPSLSERVLAALVRPMIDHRSDEFRPILRSLVDKVKQVMQTNNDVAVLTSSGTGGLEAVRLNFLKKGDNVIVPVCGVFSNMLCDYVRNAGANVVKVEAPPGDQPRLDQIKETFEKTKNVKAIFTVYDETATGVTYTWFKEIGELCAKHGSFFIVDAHAVMGALDLPVDRLNIDVCVAVSQIGIGGPPGICFVSISNKAKKYLSNNPPESVYFNLPSYLKWYERESQTPFTPATQVIIATNEALNMVLEEGLKIRFQRVGVCADAFYAGFDAMGLDSVAKKELRSKLMLSIKYPNNIKENDFTKILYDKYDIYVYKHVPISVPSFRIGTVGSDPIFRETRVLTTIAAISSVCNILGHKVDSGKAIEAATSKLEGYPS